MGRSVRVVRRSFRARRRAGLVALFGILLTFGLTAPVLASGMPPVANDQSESTVVSTPVDIFLNATDNENDILTFVIVSNPSHGTVGGPNCADAAICTYTPTNGYIGGDSFTWKANDGTSDSNVATVTITVTPLTSHKILSAGPLTRIEITNDLNCAVDHTGDSAPEFYGDTACGSLVAVGGTLFGPNDIPAGDSASPRTAYIPVSQTDVLGSGTVGDPYRIVTVVDLGTTGLHLTETDSYVVGQETYRTDVQIASSAGTPVAAILYRAGDCYLQNSDRGFGAADVTTGAVSCVAGVNNGGTIVPGTRIEQWYPLSAGSSYYESNFDSVWAKIGTQTSFANSCEECPNYIDNGAGLSWNVTIPAGGSVTRSHLTVFSPLGIVPLTTTKTAGLPTVTAGRSDTYTITVANPNTSPATLTSITDTLPAGFIYAAGSTTGATTTDPAVMGQSLTWVGSFPVPASGSITLTFGVTVSVVPGMYTNQAGAVADSPYVVVGTGQTAPVTVVAAASLTLTKQVSGGTALPTAWTLSATGPTPISGHSGEPAITAAAVDAGTYTLAESGGPTGYSAGAWGCTGGGILTGSSLVLAAGETVSCSITNTFIPPTAASLTLTKQVSGGTALPTAWTLSATGPTPISGHSGEPAITAAAVDAGTYTLAESGGPTGYSAGAWGCTGGGILTGSSLVLAAGETVSCSITNTFIPPTAASLTLTKQVSGGTALPTAWTLSATGPTPISGHSGEPAITAAAVDAGTYTLAESGGPTGYSAGAWGCTGGGILTGSSLVLAAGETVSCSITNTFIPPTAASLTLTKQVSGGTALPTAWTLSATGPTPISGHSGEPAITAAAVDAGTYTLAESGGPTGYSAGAWGCTGGGILTGSSLVLAAGETVSCSITNTFIPPTAASLTLTKQVSGGTALPTAWTLSATGPTPISGHSGEPAITAAAVDAGTYTLAESGGPTGYSAGAWGCTGGGILTGSSLVLAAGETVSCSITNTFIPPTAASLTLTKQVSGGTALPTAWTLSATGPTPISGHSGEPAITAAAVDAGTYTLAESGGPTGYSAGAWGCTGGGILTGSSLVLAAGETVSCSITNTFIPPTAASLTLTKQVSGGTALPTAWTLSATGPTPISGHSGEPAITAAAVDAGTYTLAESGGPTGYSAGAWGCTGGGILTGSSLVLAAGETVSCSITNTFSAFLERGAFVISDQGADLGATVTWFSPQWATKNHLAADPALASFKGFAASFDPSPPQVGGTWTTGPGVSPNPPKRVPAFMAVIVTSSATKDGEVITGDIVRIVLVETGSVFGTGTIVAILSQ